MTKAKKAPAKLPAVRKPREPAVRWLFPTLWEPEPGKDCYCARSLIQKIAAEDGFSRAWRVDGRITSIQRRDGTYLKSIDAFPDHAKNADTFFAFLEECFSRQCFRPTAYHDPVFARVNFPRLKWSVNSLFAPHFAGGWNHAITPGDFSGEHFIYDIRSAYLSALQHGLPDPDSYRATDSITDDGLYVIEHDPKASGFPFLPYPFGDFRRVAATKDEIDVYDLKPTRVLAGVRWSRPWNSDALYKEIRSLSFWKQAGRMYWGRWAMTQRVEMVGGNTGVATPMKSIFTNMIWAHLILSRIRLRLWHEVLHQDVRHVFTDSIITLNARKTGERVGDWKLVRRYPTGVHIGGPGKYGPLWGTLDKWAGVPVARREGMPQRSPSPLDRD